MPDGYDTGHPVQDWWNRVSDGWKNFWSEIGDRAVSYYDQSQVGNNAAAQLGQGIASGETTPDEAAGSVLDAIQGTSAKTAGTFDLSSILGSSAYASSPALQSYYEMYQKTGNEAYLEKLIDSAYNLENISSAREYEKNMSDTAVSRMMEDIQNAGYNPWLALQGSISSASSGSGVMASSSGISGSSQANSAKNASKNVNADVAGNVLRALVMIAILALK